MCKQKPLTDEQIEHLRQEYRWRAQDNASDITVTHTLNRFGGILATLDAFKAERDGYEKRMDAVRDGLCWEAEQAQSRGDNDLAELLWTISAKGESK